MTHVAFVAVLSGGLMVACMFLLSQGSLWSLCFIFLMGSMAFALFFSFLHWFGMSGIEVLFIHPGPGPQGITTEVLRDSDKG